MKAMNFESTKWRREAIDEVVVDDETLARRRRRRNILIAVAAVVLLVVAAVFMFGGSGEKAAAPKGAEGQSLPAVTVIVPGRQDIPAIISATGSLAAASLPLALGFVRDSTIPVGRAAAVRRAGWVPG